MLKKILKDKIHAKGASFKQSTLAREAGVSEELVHRIIHGKTENPGINTIIKLADILECSLDELTGRNPLSLNKNFVFNSSVEVNTDLIIETFEFLKKYLAKQSCNLLKLSDVLYLIHSICDYSSKNNSGKLHEEFAIWIYNDIIKDK